MSDSGKPKRRIILIKKRFQLNFILWVVFLIALSSVCSAALLYLMLFSNLGDQLWMSHLQISNAWTVLGPSFITGYLFSIVIVCLAAAIVVLRTSHRIAGPVYRFETLCKAVKEGNYDVSPKIRHRDKFADLAMAFGEMLGGLRMRQKEQFGLLNQAVTISNKLREMPSLPQATIELLDGLDERLSTLAVKTGWKADG